MDVVFGRRGLRPRLLILLLASVFLVSCGVDLSGGNWPGLTAEGDIVYVANGPSVRAFDVRQQQLLWSWPEESGTQFYAPPALRADLMAVGDFGASGGFLSPSVVVTVYMLDKPGSRQPQSRWTDMEGADDRIIAGPVLTDDQVFFVTADNVVLAYTAETGGLEWKVSLGQGQGIWGTPTYGDGVLYVASLDHAVYALDASDGSQRWRSQLNGATVGQPTLGESLLYVGNFDGRVHALSLDTGAQAWETEAGDWIWGSPTLVDNVLYYGDMSGRIQAVSALDGRPLWQAQADGPVQASPLVVGNRLYIASVGDTATASGQLLALEADSGAVIWRQTTPDPLFASPVWAADRLVVAVTSQDRLLLVYNPDSGALEWEYAPES